MQSIGRDVEHENLVTFRAIPEEKDGLLQINADLASAYGTFVEELVALLHLCDFKLA